MGARCPPEVSKCARAELRPAMRACREHARPARCVTRRGRDGAALHHDRLAGSGPGTGVDRCGFRPRQAGLHCRSRHDFYATAFGFGTVPSRNATRSATSRDPYRPISASVPGRSRVRSGARAARPALRAGRRRRHDHRARTRRLQRRSRSRRRRRARRASRAARLPVACSSGGEEKRVRRERCERRGEEERVPSRHAAALSYLTA